MKDLQSMTLIETSRDYCLHDHCSVVRVQRSASKELLPILGSVIPHNVHTRVGPMSSNPRYPVFQVCSYSIVLFHLSELAIFRRHSYIPAFQRVISSHFTALENDEHASNQVTGRCKVGMHS